MSLFWIAAAAVAVGVAVYRAIRAMRGEQKSKNEDPQETLRRMLEDSHKFERVIVGLKNELTRAEKRYNALMQRLNDANARLAQASGSAQITLEQSAVRSLEGQVADARIALENAIREYAEAHATRKHNERVIRQFKQALDQQREDAFFRKAQQQAAKTHGDLEASMLRWSELETGEEEEDMLLSTPLVPSADYARELRLALEKELQNRAEAESNEADDESDDEGRWMKHGQ